MNIKYQAKVIYYRLRQLLEKRFRFAKRVYIIIKLALITFTNARGAEASASLAYYGFFSMFPLLLFLIAVGGYFLKNEMVFNIVALFFNEILPTSEIFITDVMQQVIKLRGPVTFIGIIGLFWAASAYFVVLTRNIDRAWPQGKIRNYIQQRVTAFKMVAVVIVLLILLLMTNTIAGLLPKLFSLIPIGIGLKESYFWNLIPKGIAWFVTFTLFVNLYRWTPNTRISWDSVLWGSGIASLAWQLAAGGFGWFLKSGLINYQFVYGSLGSIAALMFWFYMSGFILLFGAHLIAAIDQTSKKPYEKPEVIPG